MDHEYRPFNSSYGDTLRGDYGYGQPEEYNRSQSRSQVYGRPWGNWDDASAGWHSGARSYGRTFQAVYAQDGSRRDESRHATDAFREGNRAVSGHPDDFHYRNLRNEELRGLDDDYKAWHGERYSQSSKELNEWYESRMREKFAGKAL